MGILRTDIISHSQLEGTGSVEFDGNGDSLIFTTNSGLSLEGDFTIEFYIFNNTITLDTQHPSPITMPAESGHNSQIYTNSSGNYYGLYKQADIVTTGSNSALTGVWQHVAFTRKGSTCHAFLDGVLKNTAESTVTFGGTSGTYRIGSYNGSGGDVDGFISNLRIIKGKALYTVNFTVPKFELKNIAGTTLLGCQSTSSATDFAVTPNTVSVESGDAAASSFHPGLKKDITDTGVVFDGVTTFDSLAYMVPPSGKTTERNRGRGVLGGGDSQNTRVGFIDIQSQGNANEFGQLTFGRLGMSACASSTRILFCGGYDAPTNTNIIDFFTIATTSNATDFGDLLQADHEHCALSNQTRGLITGGTGSLNGIEFLTIATTGNAQDFGDITSTRRGASGGASPTRGLFCGSATPQASAQIDFVTIATTGNSADFGDLTVNRGRAGSVSSSVRTVIAGGYTPSSPNLSNTIDFVTIATTGDATDFGDLSFTASQMNNGMSNNSRGVFVVTGSPSAVNNLEFITIATTGDANDFGDAHQAQNRATSGSDSHGGLS